MVGPPTAPQPPLVHSPPSAGQPPLHWLPSHTHFADEHLLPSWHCAPVPHLQLPEVQLSERVLEHW
jgi:hypothetical protein